MPRATKKSSNPPKKTEGKGVSYFKIACKAIRQAQRKAVEEDRRHGLKPVLVELKLKTR